MPGAHPQQTRPDPRADGDAGEPSAATRGVVRWVAGSGRAPAAAGVLIWYVPLVIGPVTGAVAADRGWLAWPALVAASTCWFVAIATAYRTPPRPGLAAGGLAVMAVVTALATVGFDDAWTPLFILCAIGVGATTRSPRAIPAVVALTLLASGSAWLSTDHWDATWTTALPTFLAGISTYWFCLLLAVIAELARTREELADVAVSQERLRFSRDLHDLLGHTLSVIVVKAEVVRRLCADDEAAAHAADIESIGRRALAEIRQAATSYRGMTLAGELGRARLALDAAGIATTTSGLPATLPPAVDELFGWVLREGVTNVVRHSGARHCDVRLVLEGDDATIEVSDDGAAAGAAGPAETDASPGGGLVGLRERADAAGAELRLTRTPEGLTLAVRAPLRALAPSR